MFGSSGADTIHGGEDGDQVSNKIFAGRGNDNDFAGDIREVGFDDGLWGRAVDDSRFYGRKGDDSLCADGGNDTNFDGGAGLPADVTLTNIEFIVYG